MGPLPSSDFLSEEIDRATGTDFSILEKDKKNIPALVGRV